MPSRLRLTNAWTACRFALLREHFARMKHAGPSALDRLEALLRKLRGLDGLKEKSRGTFYRRGRAFIHFHEHGEDLFADARFKDEFERVRVSSAVEQKALLDRVRSSLSDGLLARGR